MRINKWIYVVFITVSVCVIVSISPLTYNYYIHPLARLAKTINTGDDIAGIEKKLNTYEMKYQNKGMPQITIRFPDSTCDYQDKMQIKGCINIYDESIFDPVYLNVFFDKDGKVLEKHFIGD